MHFSGCAQAHQRTQYAAENLVKKMPVHAQTKGCGENTYDNVAVPIPAAIKAYRYDTGAPPIPQ